MLGTQAKGSDRRGVNKLSLAMPVMILNGLCEGVSMRAISRIA